MNGTMLSHAVVDGISGFPLMVGKSYKLHTDLADELGKDPPVHFTIHSISFGKQIVFFGKALRGPEEEFAKIVFNSDSLSELSDLSDEGRPIGELEILENVTVGAAKCGCVYHAEEGIPCMHDFKLAVKKF